MSDPEGKETRHETVNDAGSPATPGKVRTFLIWLGLTILYALY